MGLVNFIAKKYGAPAIMEIIEQKSPELAVLIDRLDEMSLPEAFAEFHRFKKQKRLSEPLRPTRINHKQIDWDTYKIRLLTEKPALKVILDLMAEFGIGEISGIALDEFLQCLTEATD